MNMCFSSSCGQDTFLKDNIESGTDEFEMVFESIPSMRRSFF